MSMEWWRCKHGAPYDPKWRAVAARAGAGIRPGDVWAVFTALCDRASQAAERGSLAGLDDEDIAAGLGYEIEHVQRILVALKSKGLIDDASVTTWEKHQPKREDDGATQRKRDQRERDAASRTVTQSHDREEKTRTDTDKKDSEAKASAPAAQPDFKREVWKTGKKLKIEASALGEMGKLCAQDWASLAELLGRCEANKPIDPTSWCFAELRPANQAQAPPKKDKLTLKLEEMDRQEARKKANGNGIHGGSAVVHPEPHAGAISAPVRRGVA